MSKKRIRWAKIFRTFFKSSIDIVCLIDGDGHFLEVNRRFCELTGYSRKELLAMSISDVEAIETREQILQELNDIRLYGKIRFQTVHRRKDGSLFDVEVYSHLVGTENEDIFLSFYRDISKDKKYEKELLKNHDYLKITVKEHTKELARSNKALQYEIEVRKSIEEALRTSEERLNNFMNAATDVFILADSKLNILELNNAANKVFGIKKNNAIGKKFWELPELISIGLGAGPIVDKLQQVLITGIPFFEDIVSTESNSKQPSLSVSAFKAGNGLGLILTDIGKRIYVQTELRRLNEELEHRVEERTNELKKIQEKLLQQEKLAVLGQLTAGLAHELRQPLGVIQNAVYLLNTTPIDYSPEVQEALDIINLEVTTSDRIISSLLDFARQSPVTKRKSSVNDIIRSAISRLTVPNIIKIDYQLDDSLPQIMTDPDKLERAFINITLNAFQAMPSGGRLNIISNMQDSNWISISFSDTGKGISGENLKRVFEPLFTTKTIGIGLGLTIAKTMVTKNEGTLEVKSDLGKGSIFTIKLPAGQITNEPQKHKKLLKKTAVN